MSLGSLRFLPLCSLILASFMLSACVPYVRHQELTTELDRANEINADLQSALRNIELSMAENGSDVRLMEAGYSSLKAERDRLQQLLAEREAMYARLKSQLEDMDHNPLPIPSGFGADDEATSNLELTSRGTLAIQDVLFLPGRHSLRQTTRSKLEGLLSLLKGKYAGRTIHLDGHSDNVPIKSSKNADNWELSAKRAHAVFQFLAANGIPMELMRIHGHGSAVPADRVEDPNSKAGRKRCRRVEVRLGG